MSWISYTTFPRALEAFRISEVRGREKEFGITYDISHWRRDDVFLLPSKSPEESHIVVIDIKNARFDSCFENEFIYQLIVDMPEETKGQRTEIVKKYRCEEKISGYLDKKNMNKELEKYWEIEWAKQRQALHDFINENINHGEFVEKYTSWDNHEGEIFRPPTIEKSMTLQEYLDRPMPTKGERLNLNERYKTIIHKTK